MFWDKGLDDLTAKAHAEEGEVGKYRFAIWCVSYWQRLNPQHEVRVLDDVAAAALSPSYRALKKRHLLVQTLSDVLRLELLSLYGGVWCDITTCPTTPLDEIIARTDVQTNGFFAWHGPWYTTEFERADTCLHTGEVNANFFLEAAGMMNIDTWFLIAPHPHNFLVDAWLDAMLDAMAELPDWASPWADDEWARYDYHVAHCVFNQIYADRADVRAAFDRLPKTGYCEQHRRNAVEWCGAMYMQIEPDYDVSGMEQEGYPYWEMDEEPDGAKFMYKGWTSLAWMDFQRYDAFIARKEALYNESNQRDG